MNFARSKGLSVPAEGDSILSWSLGRKLTGPLRLGRRAPQNVGLQDLTPLLLLYGESPRGELAGRRLIVAADRRIQQKRS